MNCNTTHYRANSSSVPGDPTAYASPTLRYPKTGDKPVIEGTVDGRVTYERGRFGGEIGGTANLRIPGLEKLASNGVGLGVQARLNPDGTYGGSIELTEELTLGKHLKVTQFRAEIDKDGDIESEIGVEVVNIAGLKRASAAGKIHKGGDFTVERADIGVAFGTPHESRAWGTLDVSYAQATGFILTGKGGAIIRPGLEAEAELIYRSLTDEVDLSVTTAKPIQLLEGGDEKTFWSFSKQTELVSFYKIIGIYLNTEFDLKFRYKYDLKVTPSIKILGINLRDWSFDDAIAVLSLSGGISAALIGTPKLGLGLFVLSPDILGGDGGLGMNLMAEAKLDATTDLVVGYKPDGGFTGDARLGLGLNFGISAEIFPYAQFSVLDDTWNPTWTGDALSKFDILPPREVFRLELDLNKSLEPVKQPKLPDQAAPAANPPAGRNFENKKGEFRTAGADKRTPPGETHEKPTDGGDGFSMATLTDKLKDLPGYSTFAWVFRQAERAIKAGKWVYDKGKWVVNTAAELVEDGIDAVGDGLSYVGGGLADGASALGGLIGL